MNLLSTGIAKDDESSIEAAIRETKDLTGLEHGHDYLVKRIMFVFEDKQNSGERITIRITFFAGQLKEPTSLRFNRKKISGIAWLSLKDALKTWAKEREGEEEEYAELFMDAFKKFDHELMYETESGN